MVLYVFYSSWKFQENSLMSLFKKQCFILLNPDQEFFQVEDDFWDLKLNLRFSV